MKSINNSAVQAKIHSGKNVIVISDKGSMSAFQAGKKVKQCYGNAYANFAKLGNTSNWSVVCYTNDQNLAEFMSSNDVFVCSRKA